MVTDRRTAERIVRAAARLEEDHDRALATAEGCLEFAYVVWAAEVRLSTAASRRAGNAKEDPAWMRVRKQAQTKLKRLAKSCRQALSRDETALARIFWVRKCADHALSVCRPDDCWIRAREHTESPYREDAATGCAAVEALRLAAVLPSPEELDGSQAQGWAEEELRRSGYGDFEW